MGRLQDYILPPDTRANQPSAASVGEGALYFVTDETVLERSSGSAWETFAASTGSGDIRSDGTVDFAADQSMGGFKLTDLDDPSAPQDAATKNYVDTSAGAGAVVQVVNFETGAVATGTTVIPIDDTIPQNTEGDEYMTLAITPTDAAHKLKIEVVAYLANTITNNWMMGALFKDSTVGALAAAGVWLPTTPSITVIIAFTHYMTAGSTSPITFKFRAGHGFGSGTTTFNGSAGGRILGGVLASSITITEITP